MKASFLFAVLALGASHTQAASKYKREPPPSIYPDDHWSYSTKLTVGTFNDVVQAEIDAGKTMFAPAWNRVVKAFAEDPKVSFGDVHTGQEPIREGHDPGKGGWPTIRYFNKETGLAGESYTKKVEGMSMCDELGKDEYMTLYVEEAGKTILSATETGGDKDEKDEL